MVLLEKDGIRMEVLSPVDVARLKALGYKEVKPEAPAAPQDEAPKSFADEQQEIVEEALQPSKSKAKKGK